jgi:serine/threonine protein kinase
MQKKKAYTGGENRKSGNSMDSGWTGRVVCSAAARLSGRGRTLDGAETQRLRLGRRLRSGPEPPADPTDRELRLHSVLGSGVYGTVYSGSFGEEQLAVKCVPLLDQMMFEELIDYLGDDMNPEAIVKHFTGWQKTMMSDSTDAVNNPALCEANFYEMASDLRVTSGAPWFVQFYGAFKVGTLDVTGERTPPRSRRPAPRATWVEARIDEYCMIVRQFNHRVPSVLVCTSRCQESMARMIFKKESIDYQILSGLLGQAAAAVLFLKSIGLTHNDYHMDNIMVEPTDSVDICIRGDRAAEWRVPTNGYILKVVDYGLSTVLCSSAGRKRKRAQILLNQSSLQAIRYRRNDPNVDLRTLLLDLATRGKTVWPPGQESPEWVEHSKRLSDPLYRSVAHCVETFTRSADDRPGERPWLLRLLEDYRWLRSEVEAINAEDDESDGSDDLSLSLGRSILAIRRVANSRKYAKKQTPIPATIVAQMFLGGFVGAHQAGDLVIQMPSSRR